MKPIITPFKILFFTFFIYYFSYGQETNFVIPDSLKSRSFESLEKSFNHFITDKTIRKLYGNVYYKKSKTQKKDIVILNGMYLQAIVTKSDIDSSKYLDSIIDLTKENENIDYPAKAYMLKSDYAAISDNNFKRALMFTLEAEKYALKTGNIEQAILIKQQIGLIKISLGKYKEALPLIKENYNYFKSKDSNSYDYKYCVFLMSDLYNKLEIPDAALLYSNKCLESMDRKNTLFKHLKMNNGISYYIKKNFKMSNAIFDDCISDFEAFSVDKLNLAICYYYKGENVTKIEHNLFKAKKYFKKVDSILSITKEYTQDTRGNYIRLIEIAKKEKQDKEQLYYLNRLIQIDSFLNEKKIVVSEKINTNYDTPHLLSEKQEIITKMNYERYQYIGIGIISLVGIGIMLFYLLKTRKHKKLLEEKFNNLIKETTSKKEDIDIPIEKTKTLDIPKGIAEMILKKLIAFENSYKYLEQNINLNDFAKQLETNSNYLSKTINYYKSKNFSQYINDMRIDYTINKLKNDNTFRKYTIKAISEEVGFSNTESFTKAFYVKTGLQPSYFIKKIEEKI
jgi:AraC-like DNA-binding protein